MNEWILFMFEGFIKAAEAQMATQTDDKVHNVSPLKMKLIQINKW